MVLAPGKDTIVFSESMSRQKDLSQNLKIDNLLLCPKSHFIKINSYHEALGASRLLMRRISDHDMGQASIFGAANQIRKSKAVEAAWRNRQIKVNPYLRMRTKGRWR